MSWSVIRLRSILESEDQSKIQRLSGFSCSRDLDLEVFLHERAILYEKRDRFRTYLIVDSNDEGDRLVAYISLAITHVTVNPEVKLSKSIIRRMDLCNNSTNAYLIGQLAKDDRVEAHIGHDLVEQALDLIRPGFESYGCRMVCVDCKESLLDFNEKESFFKIGFEPNHGLHRMVCLI